MIVRCLLLLCSFGALDLLGPTELHTRSTQTDHTKNKGYEPSSICSCALSVVFAMPYQPWWRVQTIHEQYHQLCHSLLPSKLTHPNQSVFGLKLLLRRLIIINQRKSCAPAPTKLCSEAKCNNTRLLCLVQSGQFFRELSLGYVRS
jgi:hypothetical protein